MSTTATGTARRTQAACRGAWACLRPERWELEGVAGGGIGWSRTRVGRSLFG